MITGDKYINLALKRFVSHNRLKDNFLDYLLDGQREHTSRIFPDQGLFTYPATLTHPGTSGNTYVDFSPDPIIGSDGEGHILSAAGSSVLIDVPFPKTASKDYWFALYYAEKPSGMYLNPRTGLPEYDTWEEAIGRSAAPDSIVSVVAGAITFDISAITDAGTGVDYSGKTATVWLNNPQSSDESIAIETISITNPSGTNIIVTSANSLGQASASTTASDYTVCLNGIVWEEVATGAGNPFASDYTILGYLVVDGGGTVTATYDSAVENDISGGLGSLQTAYDYTGAGAGRTIQANDQAVEITQENTVFHEDDIIQAGLRISKDDNGAVYDGTDKDNEVGVDVVGRAQMYGGVVYRARIIDESGGTDVQKDETITTNATNRVSFTRALSNVEFANVTYQSLIPSVDLVEISGSAQGNDGVYLINSISSGAGNGNTYIDVMNLDGTGVTFGTGEVGITANIYRPVARLGGSVAGMNTEMSGGLKIATLGDAYNEYAGPGAQYGGGIDIIVPTNTHDDSEIIVSDRNSTDTFTVYADAEVKTTGDVTIDHASNNFQYSAARTFYKNYCAADFVVEQSNPYAHHGMANTIGTGTPNSINIVANPFANMFALLPLNNLPNGATITQIECIVDPNATSDPIIMGVRRNTSDWTTPTNTAAQPTGYASVSTSGAAIQIISLPSAAQTFTIDYSQYTYELAFTGDGITNPTGGKIYQVRVTYTATDVIP